MKTGGEIRPPAVPNAAIVVWILRIGVAGCFIGHGVFGIVTKQAWLPYFAVGGVSESAAWRLMPWIGAMDITVGLLALVRPCRALFIWAVIWTVWTALLRPLAGESVWEFFERGGNYGVPLALLAIVGWRGAWFDRLPALSWSLDTATLSRFATVLRLTTATLLLGHAGCGLINKPLLTHLYGGVIAQPSATFVQSLGLVEVGLAAVVLVFPSAALLVFVCVWKLASEALFPLCGAPIWEFVERFGSYTAPLALAAILANRSRAETPQFVAAR